MINILTFLALCVPSCCLYKDARTSPSRIAIFAASLAGALWVLWLLYHVAIKGAAQKCFNISAALSPSVSLHKQSVIPETEGDLCPAKNMTGEDVTFSPVWRQ